MEKLNTYREVVERILRPYAAQPPSHGQVETKLVVDRDRDEYLLLGVGWDANGRVHSVYGHVHLRDGKVCVERDGTEIGLAVEFVEAGIPKDDIVLAFLSPRAAQADRVRGCVNK